MRCTHHRSSLLDCFCADQRDSARQCLRRAALCSRLAKLVGGPLRRKLYRLKNHNIRAALARPGGAVEVRMDQDLYFGLLSVRLRDSTGPRVHTHPNWIDAA